MIETCFSLFERGKFAPFVNNVKALLSIMLAHCQDLVVSQEPETSCANLSGIVTLHAFFERSVHPEMNIMSFNHPHVVPIMLFFGRRKGKCWWMLLNYQKVIWKSSIWLGQILLWCISLIKSYRKDINCYKRLKYIFELPAHQRILK